MKSRLDSSDVEVDRDERRCERNDRPFNPLRAPRVTWVDDGGDRKKKDS